MRALILITALMGLEAFALVGGKASGLATVVPIRRGEHTFCTGAVVGIKPLTILTAAHCFKSGIMQGVHVFGMVPRLVHKDIGGLGRDLAVMIFDADAKIDNLIPTSIFSLENRDLDLENFDAEVRLCGYGRESSPPARFVDENKGLLKCGRNAYIKGTSFKSDYHTLFTSKMLRCRQRSVENFAGISVGDSGGPLFIQKEGKAILIGLAYQGYFNLDNPEALSCGVSAGELFLYHFTSTSLKNIHAQAFFKKAQELGADLKGYN